MTATAVSCTFLPDSAWNAFSAAYSYTPQRHVSRAGREGQAEADGRSVCTCRSLWLVTIWMMRYHTSSDTKSPARWISCSVVSTYLHHKHKQHRFQARERRTRERGPRRMC